MNRYEIDFYKEFELEHPTAGLIHKITSPKGTRKLEKHERYSYHLKSDLIEVYNDRPTDVEAGLYWVMDVFKLKGQMTWCHYLFIVEEDGSIYPVAEFLKCTDTQWVKLALPIIKAYFAKTELDPIDLTMFSHPKNSSSWRVKR